MWRGAPAQRHHGRHVHLDQRRPQARRAIRIDPVQQRHVVPGLEARAQQRRQAGVEAAQRLQQRA
jgi:hypothetical protein